MRVGMIDLKGLRLDRDQLWAAPWSPTRPTRDGGSILRLSALRQRSRELAAPSTLEDRSSMVQGQARLGRHGVCACRARRTSLNADVTRQRYIRVARIFKAAGWERFQLVRRRQIPCLPPNNQ